MILRTIAALISTTCLLFLVFTDLDTTQRLLLAGVILWDAVIKFADFLEERQAKRRECIMQK
jgi:hypothetical protein